MAKKTSRTQKGSADRQQKTAFYTAQMSHEVSLNNRNEKLKIQTNSPKQSISTHLFEVFLGQRCFRCVFVEISFATQLAIEIFLSLICWLINGIHEKLKTTPEK